MSPVYRKIAIRLVPFLMLLYFFAFLDRINVSFAALTMNREIGISEKSFGIAAGIFFLGYFLFEIPSNLILIRLGARRWIATIMVVWGLLSVATAFVHAPMPYYLLRFLLGVAESGFYPGIILYLTFWLPAATRAALMALFITAIPISGIIGSPISGKILLLNQIAGMQGWQWLFFLEGIPTILLGLLVCVVLADTPQDVHWLTTEEKQQVAKDIAADLPAPHNAHGPTHGMTQRPHEGTTAFSLSLAYFALMTGLYGISFWTPKILNTRGAALSSIGWLTAIPYLAGTIGMLLWSRRSDRRQERTRHLMTAYFLAAIGLIVVVLSHSIPATVFGFSLGAIGIFSAMPIFWSASTLRLAGPKVGVYIAVINSIGNLGGFASPMAVGWLVQVTHSFAAGLAIIAALLLLGTAALQKIL